MRQFLTFATCCCLLSLSLFSCKKKKNDTGCPEAGDPGSFSNQRPSMLANIGNNIIIANYQALNVSTSKLDSAVGSFATNPDSIRLAVLRATFKTAYLAWQRCSAFGFGPADQEYLGTDVNTFPVDTAKVNSNVTAGGYNLDATANLAAKGFPALDYLLFGVAENDSTILSKYTTDSKAANRKQYVVAVSARIKTKVNTVLNDWLPSGGNYINTFTNASGTDIGSSLGQFINAMVYDYEILKNYKLALPLGKQSTGTLYPQKVEAFYSGISSQLALAQLLAIQNIYLGRSAQGDGLGLDDYLAQINAQYNCGSLNDVIKSQFAQAISTLQAVPDPLSSTIQNNFGVADAAYKEVQKLLVLLKNDLPSAMGVLITFGDTDGD